MWVGRKRKRKKETLGRGSKDPKEESDRFLIVYLLQDSIQFMRWVCDPHSKENRGPDKWEFSPDYPVGLSLHPILIIMSHLPVSNITVSW